MVNHKEGRGSIYHAELEKGPGGDVSIEAGDALTWHSEEATARSFYGLPQSECQFLDPLRAFIP
jgi:hypothetical protein